MDEYLSIKIEAQKASTIKMYKLYLTKKTPEVTSKILHRDIEGTELRTKW